MIGSEGIVGLPALLGREKSGQNVIGQAPLTALRMTSVNFKAAFERSTAVRNVMLRYTGTLLEIASQTAACNRLHSLKERCARWLLTMGLQSDAMPLTHEFLSMMLGVRRSRVTESAGELQRLGLIRYHRGQVNILDHAALTATACECYWDHDRLIR
jgi:CRP-like cAMP-binding protein